ncbi:MAG: glycosyltransferase, partial [Gammaproteobacteria bacterium]
MKFSIITAVYNGASTIGTTLASVAMQERISTARNHLEVEHLIVDAASTDGTAEQARSWPAPIRVISEPDRGIFDGMNKGIAWADGDVVGILNADDFYFSPLTLGLVADALASKKVDSCYGNVVYVDAEQPHRVLRVWRSR